VSGVKEYVSRQMEGVREFYPEIEYVKISIQPDHVHMVVSFPPKYSIAYVVGVIKSNTSKGLYDKFTYLQERYRTRHVWSIGYYVSTVGVNEEQIKQYVEYQGKEDLGQAELAF
jgi:putative transposase